MDRSNNPERRVLPRLVAMTAAALAVVGGTLVSDAQAHIGSCKQQAPHTASGYVLVITDPT